MSDVAIRVTNIGKRYRVAAARERQPYGSLRESLTNAVRAPLARLQNGDEGTRSDHEIWALRDISFEVKHGEALGIVGRNGAGKSTLLKVLSRITEPTCGRAEVYGRVGALLEVGTGFHPELSGRENIYLNGAILGMSRGDIDRKFDEIVAFAELEKFLDTPVKRYSSGMYMRLAFSVAAHLEPEILVIDEVLAVGDAGFQKKCLGKMGDVSREGRTVLFVSHNLPAVGHLCSTGILLEQGVVQHQGPTPDVLQAYLAAVVKPSSDVYFPAPSDGSAAYFTRLGIRDGHGKPTAHLPHSEPFVVEMQYVVRRRIAGERLSWMLAREDGVSIVGSVDSDWPGGIPEAHEPGEYVATVTFPPGILNQGTFQYRVALGNPVGGYRDYKYGPYFEIYDDTSYGAVNSGGSRDGVILLRLEWSERRLT